MKPKNLMLLGIMTLAVGLLTEALSVQGLSATILCFAGGCVFGKGYGVHEERSRRAALSREEGR